ncbi:MAG: DNA-binding domain-containing protein [Oscillospiraceae bacterium]|nr:DNA-binding domain-containing protein [Oscillospiraceae bacterium]
MNVTEHWITTKEAAACLIISERAIQIQIERETAPYTYKYVNGIGKGGKQLRILLESLPAEAQERYNGTKPICSAPIPLTYDNATQKQREAAELKLEAVLEYTDFKRKFHKRGVTREFIKQFKEKHPGFNINCGVLEDWVNKYAEYGVEGLLDRRGGSRVGATTLTEEMQNVFKAYYLTDKKPSIHQCYIATREVMAAKGIEVPSESSFKRYIKNVIPDVTIALYREGEKYFDDNFLPAIFTDYDAERLYSNSMWVADHHKCDVLVKYEDKIIRPWITAFTDFKSRYIVGYIVFPYEPNSDFILNCLAEAVKKCGVPDMVLTDNGKDYKSHDLFKTDNDYSIVSILQSAVRTALPYNAKAKPIERNFRTIESICKMLPSYIGDRPENRPTTMKGTNKKIERENKAMDFEEFKKFMDNNINIYHNTVHTGNGMNGRTPLETYKQSFSAAGMKTLSEKAISLIFRRTTRKVTITEHGVKFAELPNVGYYISPELLLYGVGRKVYARYDTSDVTTIYIYSEDGKYICEARNAALFVFGAGREVQKQIIRDNNNYKKALRKKDREAYPHGTEVPSIMEIAARRSEAFGAPDFSDIPKLEYDKQLGINSADIINGSDSAPEDEDFDYGEENEYLTRLENFG